jgi:hypothetical protein
MSLTLACIHCHSAVVLQVVGGIVVRPAACYLCKLPDIPGKFQVDKVQHAPHLQPCSPTEGEAQWQCAKAAAPSRERLHPLKQSALANKITVCLLGHIKIMLSSNTTCTCTCAGPGAWCAAGPGLRQAGGGRERAVQQRRHRHPGAGALTERRAPAAAVNSASWSGSHLAGPGGAEHVAAS